MKVKNVGTQDYTGAVEVAAGEVAEVSEGMAAYLLSEDCPGKFEAVGGKADPKAKK